MNNRIYEEVIAVINAMDEMEAIIKDVNKLDGVKKGIAVRKTSDNFSTVVYIDQMLDNSTVGEIVNYVLDSVATGRKNFNVNVTKITEALNNLDVYARIVPRNAGYLAGKVTREFLDMNIVYYIKATENGNIMITDSLLNMTKHTEEDLYRAALDKIENNFEYIDMREVLAEQMGVDASEIDMPGMMNVLSNKGKMFGAVSIISKNVMDYALKKSKLKKAYVLPSSIHEVILVPTETGDVEVLRNMVREVNATQLTPDEILSENVYVYDIDKGRLEIA